MLFCFPFCTGAHSVEIFRIGGTCTVSQNGFRIIQIDFGQTHHVGIGTRVARFADAAVVGRCANDVFLDVGSLVARILGLAIGITSVFHIHVRIELAIRSYRIVAADSIVHGFTQCLILIGFEFFP